MPAAEDDPPPAQLKDWFDEKRHRAIAAQLADLSGGFQKKEFLRLTLEGLEQRSLMQRLHQCALAAEAALPGGYREKARLLEKLAPRLGHSFVSIFTCDYVATFGLADFDFSMSVLRSLTRSGSAEFAVRPFIAADPPRALATMRGWAADADEHVRRLASEGSRPRLPWGMKLRALVEDPSLAAPILDALRGDGSPYVRRSVANHLNDITKDHPDWVLSRLEGWDLAQAHPRWIARHACRTLVKRGHPRALRLFGYGGGAQVRAALTTTPSALRLGDRLYLRAELQSTTATPQALVVDYVVHYVKARGAAFEKVFKWAEVALPAHGSLTLEKTQTIRDFTTRRHHPGHHAVELQVNGVRIARAGFDLLKGPA